MKHKLCPVCHKLVNSRRKDATYCCNSCKVKNYKKRKIELIAKERGENEI